MTERALQSDCNSNLYVMAALFNQSREDPVSEYEHILQSVLDACSQFVFGICLWFPVSIFCIKTIPRKTHDSLVILPASALSSSVTCGVIS